LGSLIREIRGIMCFRKKYPCAVGSEIPDPFKCAQPRRERVGNESEGDWVFKNNVQ